MAQDFSDTVRQNLSKIKESPESAADFVKNALLTGWSDEDIGRGFFLNGITKEETTVYLIDGHRKFKEILGS